MSVFRVRGSPYYQFDFQIEHYRAYGSTKETNKSKALAFEDGEKAEVRRLIREARAAGRQPMTLDTGCDQWWDEVGQFGKDPDIERALEWLKAQIGPTVWLHSITDDMINEAIQARRQCVMKAGRERLPAPKKKGSRRKFVDGKQLYRPISNRTVNKTVPSLLRRILNRARDTWKVAGLKDPNREEIKWKGHFLPEVKRPVREIKVAEDALLDEVESRDYAGLREFAEIMGLRRREMLLTWPQVDFMEKTIAIIGKGGIPAILPLPQRAYEILWGLRGNHPNFVFTFIAQRTRRCPKTGTEFVKDQRYPMTYYGIGTNRRRQWPKAGVNARLHDTRHTAGQRTLRATGNLKLVQTLLRHTEIGTTAKFYTDTNMEDLRAGLEATESRKKSQTALMNADNTLKNKA